MLMNKRGSSDELSLKSSKTLTFLCRLVYRIRMKARASGLRRRIGKDDAFRRNQPVGITWQKAIRVQFIYGMIMTAAPGSFADSK